MLPREGSPGGLRRSAGGPRAELADDIGGIFVSVDVTSSEQIVEAIDAAADLGPLRVLVNSAGIGGARRTIGKDGQFASAHSLDSYKKVIAVNLIGTFDCIRLAATAMSRNDPMDSGERGAIVSMARVAASTARSDRPHTRRPRAASWE